jgi:radical SAM superfamily enzyme YgiQ (UPF0313 family)
MAELQERTRIMEFDNTQTPKEIAEAILITRPRIVGFGVYIWNSVRTREVVSILKKVAPSLTVVVGGPEVSYEYEGDPLVALADYLITGEADLAFAELCRNVLSGETPRAKVINPALPALSSLHLPYSHYSDSDIANRVIYVEVSRGCPFSCEFCLSSVDIPVRSFDHEQVLADLDIMFKRGARTFKFIDRTFNLNVRTSTSILRFFLERMEPGVFVHFEMVPDRFPPALREVVKDFPPGSLQLEIGVQTLNSEVGARISRRQDVPKLIDNLSFLRKETSAYLHVDLIVGLPGETIESFGRGFDTLAALNPQEIQVGILKRLRGTPIVRHTEEFAMRYSDDPPYEVLETRDVSFLEMQKMERFARYWDLISNSGNFAGSRAYIWQGCDSHFSAFMEYSEWLYSRVGRRASIQLKALSELLFEYLVECRGFLAEEVGRAIALDYQRGGRSDLPRVLRPFATEAPRHSEATLALKRQQRAINT